MNRGILLGILAAAAAAVSWSLGFIVPFVIGDYSIFDFTLVEFLFSGVLGAALLWRNAARVRGLSVADWMAGCSLGLIGYVAYFLAVMGAAVYAGPVIAPAFLGIVPVVLAVAGNLRERTVAWRRLVLPLGLTAGGLAVVNGSGLVEHAAWESTSLLLGIPLSLVAVGLWTAFGLMNQSALAARPGMDGGVWTALILTGAGATTVLLLPVGIAFDLFELPRLGLRSAGAATFLAWAAALALCANVGGALAWTYASRRLPVALAAQMITIEPTSATLLGLLVHRRWPSALDVVGMIMLLTGVIVAIGLFARATAETAAAAR